MATTTKREITERVAKTTNQHRDVVRSVIQSFLDEVIEELSRGNRLEFRDFGVFEVRGGPPARQNPKTLVQVPVPARRAVRFKAGRLMKERVEHPVSTLGRG